MEIYRLWYLRQRGEVLGPFPEKLICRFVVLGRIGERDEVSLDGFHWQLAEDVPELSVGVRQLLTIRGTTEDVDPEWSEERARALLRWLDDRKSPDPREQSSENLPVDADQRTGRDRRQTPETVEQHAYREWRGEFDHWMRSQQERNGFVWKLGAAIGVVALLFILFNRPVNPVKVDLQVKPVDCQAPAAKSVDWSGCAMNDALLVGVDLSGAQLVGTRFTNANLSHADLRGANLAQADLAGAHLEGAKLAGATWLDGSICGLDSIGRCNNK